MFVAYALNQVRWWDLKMIETRGSDQLSKVTRNNCGRKFRCRKAPNALNGLISTIWLKLFQMISKSILFCYMGNHVIDYGWEFVLLVSTSFRSRQQDCFILDTALWCDPKSNSRTEYGLNCYLYDLSVISNSSSFRTPKVENFNYPAAAQGWPLWIMVVLFNGALSSASSLDSNKCSPNLSDLTSDLARASRDIPWNGILLEGVSLWR